MNFEINEQFADPIIFEPIELSPRQKLVMTVRFHPHDGSEAINHINPCAVGVFNRDDVGTLFIDLRHPDEVDTQLSFALFAANGTQLELVTSDVVEKCYGDGLTVITTIIAQSLFGWDLKLAGLNDVLNW
jgi:hypothetical protein